ncbi:hypothetical protein TQ32_03360 [Pyrococcus kukulkanii]|uniref:Uncharacterized protein n=1 Tax=Pyrococcus kukulkanii TaxID=1609559 RepID=A0A127BDS2_9EURY|nr:hypothetical protein TQ32_03360 [Pyrococcus kukulkanii]
MTALIAIFAGSYVVRWIFAILTAGILFAYSIEGWEPKLRRSRREGFSEEEVKRLAKIVARSRYSEVSRRIIRDHILEAYHLLGYEYSQLGENPPEGLKVLNEPENFMSKLEDSLRLLEEEVK